MILLIVQLQDQEDRAESYSHTVEVSLFQLIWEEKAGARGGKGRDRDHEGDLRQAACSFISSLFQFQYGVWRISVSKTVS